MKAQDEKTRELALERISSQIKNKRIALYLSQAAVAKASDITEEFLGRVERGEALPSLPTLMALNWTLQLNLRSIFRRPDKTTITV